MGADIRMYLLTSSGKILIDDLFEGRNSSWFDLLEGNTPDTEYDNLFQTSGIPDNVPEVIKKAYDDKDCYGFSYMYYLDYLDWFEKYKPDLQAGWVSTYDKWRMENKGYIPEYTQKALFEEDILEDMHFVAYTDKYNCDRHVLDKISDYLDEHPEINRQGLIISYYFEY